MFNRKLSRLASFPVAVGAGLVVSVTFVVTVLVEAVAGMQSFL
jgi:hypothetical protein